MKANIVNLSRAFLIHPCDRIASLVSEALYDVPVERVQSSDEMLKSPSDNCSSILICLLQSNEYRGRKIDPAAIEHLLLKLKKPILFISDDDNLPFDFFESRGRFDFITAPLRPKELRARTIKLLNEQNIANSHIEHKFNFADYELNPTQLTLSHTIASQNNLNDNSSARLTPMEFRLLHLFFTHEGQTLSREEIKSYTWGKDTHVRIRAIDKHVHGLKIKISKFNLLIECVYGKGYRFCIQKRVEDYF